MLVYGLSDRVTWNFYISPSPINSRVESWAAVERFHFESRDVLRQLLEDFAGVFEVSVYAGQYSGFPPGVF